MASCRQFFKIVLQTSLEDRKLMLSKKFIIGYGAGISSPVSLKIPNYDAKWEVELFTSDDGLIWLHKGWHEFAEYFSLEHGSFLVFRYDGNSSFVVTIFDKNGLEIEYPHNDNFVNCKSKSRRKLSQDPVDIMDELPQECRKRRKLDLPHKNMRTEDLCTPKLEPEEGLDTAVKGVELSIADSKIRSKQEAEGKRKPLSAAAKVEAHQRSDDSKSETRIFTVVMRKSYVHSRYVLVIPKAFARKHFLKKRGGIDLQASSDGRIWPLDYTWYSRKRYACITGGWKDFAMEHGLEEGDVGVFELIDQHKLLFTKLEENSSLSQAKLKLENSERNKNVNANVEQSINPSARVSSPTHEICQRKEIDFDWIEVPTSKRANNVNASNLTKASSSMNLKAQGAARKIISKKPLFEVILRSCDVSRACLNLPVVIGKDHFSDMPTRLKLYYGKHKHWKVTLLKYDECRFRFSAGWRSFVMDNSLEEGDKCIFEIINIKDSSLKVTVYNPMGSLKCKD